MRKSRGMAMFNDGVPIEKIAHVLNHSNTSSTLRYLGITREAVLQTYDEALAKLLIFNNVSLGYLIVKQ
jgi:site-specific recombinase XerD